MKSTMSELLTAFVDCVICPFSTFPAFWFPNKNNINYFCRHFYFAQFKVLIYIFNGKVVNMSSIWR